MNSRRAPGQRLINLSAKSDFVDAIDENLNACGYVERSQFIRDAMREKIARTLQKDIPAHLALPPGRLGKGGPKKKLNLSPKVKEAADKIEALAARRAKESQKA